VEVFEPGHRLVKNHLIIIGVLAISATEISAQTFQVIHSFEGNSDGANPQASLVLDGNTLFGTTANGGTNGYGTVFKVNTDGTGYSILKSFTNSPDGANPVAGLVLSSGILYGTTTSGGSAGCGTVFKINTNGSDYIVLKSFTNSPDGANPMARLTLDAGILYGTTANGGASSNGTIFAETTDGSVFTILEDFPALVSGTNGDGANPQAELVEDSGMLYGTAVNGGTNGYGTVFKLQTSGSSFSVLKHFTGERYDGANPYAGLILNGGTLYGTTAGTAWLPIGPFPTRGEVFSIATNGTTFSVLCSFINVYDFGGIFSIGAIVPGFNPVGGLLLNGNTLYGTTKLGGQDGSCGTIFEVNTDGGGFSTIKYYTYYANHTALLSTDGSQPQAGLIFSGGTFYGTTTYGGDRPYGVGNGVVFSLTFPPQIQFNDGSLAIRSNGFGFNLTGTLNQIVVIEACTNLALTNWVSLQTNTLGTNAINFSDVEWTNYPDRYYRVRTQ
jgi:uncharacterized repeat protein (TIGR03803 family)